MGVGGGDVSVGLKYNSIIRPPFFTWNYGVKRGASYRVSTCVYTYM